MNKQGIIKSVSTLFPTQWQSTTKFGVNQILFSIVMSSFSGINRICRISCFTGDGLVRVLLKVNKAINENAISTALRKLDQSSALKLQSLRKNRFKRQEHRTFIDWFISVPVKIYGNGHQMEIKSYEHHFYKSDRKELDRLIEAA